MKKFIIFLVFALCLAISSFYVKGRRAQQTLTRNDLINGVVGFVNHYYKDFIPYEVKKNQVIIDKTEYVRNIATMYDILCLQSHFYSGKKSIGGIHLSTINKIHENADYYVEIYKRNPSAMRQASAFLVLLLTMISKVKYEHDIMQITDALYQHLDDLEPRFELGEVLMALSIVNPKQEILDAQINKMVQDIEKNEPKLEDIFQYNWFSKFIAAYKNDASRRLFVVLYQKVMSILPLLTYQEETNYLAVTYECLASLALYDTSIDIDIFIEKLTAVLMNRYNQEYGLFAFRNGDMRFDITGHVINGFMCLDKIGK